MKFTQEVLGHVAYHVHTSATRLAEYLAMQEAALDAAAVDVSAAAERLRSVHQATGASGLRDGAEAATKPSTHSDQHKGILPVAPDALPPSSLPLPQWQRTRIDYSNLSQYVSTFGRGAADSSSSSISASQSMRNMEQ